MSASMLHYDVQGEGELVLLLHSGGMSGRQWKSLAATLTPTHNVVVPDFTGCGRNPPWPDHQRFSYPVDVAAVEQLLDHLGESPHLVGHSYGGFVSLELARKRPVRSLALFDPVAFGVLHSENDKLGLDDLLAAESQPIFSDEEKGGSDEWFQAFVDYWQGRNAWRSLPPPSQQAFLNVGRKVFGEVMSMSTNRTPLSAYGAINAPTLLMIGAKSPMSAQRVAILLSGVMKNAQLLRIDGAGHMGPITHAAEVNEAVRAFLTRVTP